MREVRQTASIIEPYISKEVPFRFRGIDFTFALSHGLFSSNDIDTGTRRLLQILSQTWDADRAAGHPLPRSVLDAGCGVGVIGICAARALEKLRQEAKAALPPQAEASAPPFFVRTQDRDELARLFTNYNAEKNFPKTECLSLIPLKAYTEPLLAGQAEYRRYPFSQCWDLILTNIPAKAGTPVLEDFVRRSIALLNPGGRVIMVAVNTLGDFFRSLIDRYGILAREKTGKEHTVFVYQKRTAETEAGDAEHTGQMTTGPVIVGEHFIQNNPFYLRSGAGGMDCGAGGMDCGAEGMVGGAGGMAGGDYEMEGTGYHIDAVYGAAEFDRPGGAAAAAARLVSRLGLEKICPPPAQAAGCAAILIHEGGQGHFPVWLLRRGLKADRMALSGRNILALEAARHNAKAVLTAAALTIPALSIQVIPSVELPPSPSDGDYSLIAAFPETIPGAEQLTALWEGLTQRLLPGGTALIALPSSEAEKFDRKKPASGPNGQPFTRLGDIKRQGFRALAFRRNR